MKITIIGGGNIGGAIASGLAASTLVNAADLTVADCSQAALARIKGYNAQIQTSQNNAEAIKQADLVILAVKPWLAEEVIGTFRAQMDFTRQQLASVVAGLRFESLKAMLQIPSGVTPALFRLIPNTAISLRESVTFIAHEGTSDAQIQTLEELFNQLGKTVLVTEEMMIAGTSLSSCGIAFALKFLDASMKAGVEVGFTEEESREIVMQTMQGALALLSQNHTMPQTEIDKVTTPGGLTLKGLEAMAENNFSEAVRAGVLKSR
ncbi:MAG: pyrroline-5-carboxylate reductase dimerization domain-containing protein [Alistipes sp.]|nr:pyrroline-5-carboxylate reductase dimerization domain-containing protein [Alistipes sp.]